MSPASRSNYVCYAFLFFSIPGILCAVPTLPTWLSNNSAPHTRRATAIATVTLVTQGAAILSTWLLGYVSPPPDYTLTTITFIAMSISMVVLSMVNMVYLWRENRLKAEMKDIMKKEDEPDDLGDRSAYTACKPWASTQGVMASSCSMPI